MEGWVPVRCLVLAAEVAHLAAHSWAPEENPKVPVQSLVPGREGQLLLEDSCWVPVDSPESLEVPEISQDSEEIPGLNNLGSEELVGCLGEDILGSAILREGSQKGFVDRFAEILHQDNQENRERNRWENRQNRLRSWDNRY